MSSSEATAAADQQLRPVRLSSLATRPSEPEHLPCPRCDSVNTKFCYYNNYNLSQPRHFCKSCRRYWTRGGTLRNVPVGGGSRKPPGSAPHKRPRVDPTAAAAAETALPESEHDRERVHAGNQNQSPNPNPQHMMPGGQMVTSFAGCDVNLNEAVPEVPNFAAYMSGHGNANVNVNMNGSLLPFGGGFGLGLGSGFQGLGFGIGALDWPMEPPVANQGHNDVSHGGENGVNDVSGGDGNGSGSGGSSSGNTWQMGSGVEGSLNDGDCFGWPDLAISMSGKGLK